MKFVALVAGLIVAIGTTVFGGLTQSFPVMVLGVLVSLVIFSVGYFVDD